MQIEIAKRVFSPSAEDVAHARRVVEAMGDGTGAVMLDGKMEDDASLKQCQVMLELADRLAATDPPLAELYAVKPAPSDGPGGHEGARRLMGAVTAEPAARHTGLVVRSSTCRRPTSGPWRRPRPCAVDALILDLEDAVAPDAKEQARDNACAAVRSGEYGRRELTIRVNGIGTQWHDADLRAACAAGPGRDRRAQGRLGRRGARPGRRHGGGRGARAHRALGDGRDAAGDAPLRGDRRGVGSARPCLVMGTNDLAKELHAEHVPGRAPLLTGLSLCLLAARATGTVILDGVYNDVQDAEGFAAECVQGRQLGFDGKTLIHPGQVDACNEAFAPSAAAVEDARGVLAAWEAGAGAGVVTHNGRLVESLHVETAQRVLAIDEAIAALAEQG